MIRFGVIVTVVVAAVGLLVVGAVAGDLTLVYVSIALAAVALLLLIVGVAVWRDEVFASSARRAERDLAGVGAVGHAGRAAAGSPAVENWPDRLAPTPWPGPMSAAAPELRGGDTREFSISGGALPDRDAPAERGRRSREPRPTERLPRPADPAVRPGREVRHPERVGREAEPEDRPGRDQVAPDFSSREAAASGWPGHDLAAGRPGRDAAAQDRPARDPAPGDRLAREAAAADRAARETVSAHRPDWADRYPTVVEPERYESADDPTRLAHRLDSLSEFGRPADPDATASARSRAGRAGGPRLPAPAPIDPLTGAGGEWRPAEPVAATPSTGRAAARATGTEQGPVADADAPQPGTTTPGTATDPGSRGLVPPAEAAAAEAAPTVAAPTVAAPTVAGGLVFPASPASAPAARDEGPAIATRSAAPSAARSAPSTVAAAAAGAAGSAAASEDAPSGTDPAGPSAPATVATDDEAGTRPAIGLDDQVSVVPGIARYHKTDCILIRFLSEDDLEVMSRRNAEAAGSAPCRACRPDRPAEGD